MGLFDTLFSDSNEKEWENLLKLNPIQPDIYDEAGSAVGTTKVGIKFNKAYNSIETVRRGTDMLLDAAAAIDYDVKDKLDFPSTAPKGMRVAKLSTLLNHRPNPFQDISSFRRAIFMDLIIDGNAFIHYDGAHFYHIPAEHIEIIPDKTTFIAGYKYVTSARNNKTFAVDEMIHIKENSTDSIYRGDSRLQSAQKSIDILASMFSYQENFFDNGAVPGLVLMTDDILSDRIKNRMVDTWMRKYNPRSGGRRPVVLDGGLKIDSVNSSSFKELDFSASTKDIEDRILKAIGVPPVLLNSGNNANLSPNVKLFYLTTVIPLITKVISAYEAFFAYDVDANLTEVVALRPEMRDESAYYTGLVNNGIMKGTEAREALRLEPLDDPTLDEIRIPANVAGSATGVSGEEGGKPSASKE